MKIFKNEISLITILIIFVQLFFLTCEENNDDPPKSSLIIRDNVIYKNGSDIPFTGREKAKVENKIIESKYNPGLVSELTNLNKTEVIRFMRFCNFDRKYLLEELHTENKRQ